MAFSLLPCGAHHCCSVFSWWSLTLANVTEKSPLFVPWCTFTNVLFRSDFDWILLNKIGCTLMFTYLCHSQICNIWLFCSLNKWLSIGFLSHLVDTCYHWMIFRAYLCRYIENVKEFTNVQAPLYMGEIDFLKKRIVWVPSVFVVACFVLFNVGIITQTLKTVLSH